MLIQSHIGHRCISRDRYQGLRTLPQLEPAFVLRGGCIYELTTVSPVGHSNILILGKEGPQRNQFSEPTCQPALATVTPEASWRRAMCTPPPKSRCGIYVALVAQSSPCV